ncbi:MULTISPECIES: transposase, partial [Rhizobium]|uniref:transposase n=1 Tax=Rhizobium sophoriradicis TaxID=1535245 RepID=UPI001FDF920D
MNRPYEGGLGWVHASARVHHEMDLDVPALHGSRRRSAVEPVIGHIKNEHRMDRNYLAGQQGDAINAVLAAVGYNFSLLLNWFRDCLCLLAALLLAALPRSPHVSASHAS